MKDIIHVAEEKDYIDEETIELLQPYIDLRTPKGEEVFTGDVAKKSSAALAGLCVWVRGLSDYHKSLHPEYNKYPKFKPTNELNPSPSKTKLKERVPR